MTDQPSTTWKRCSSCKAPIAYGAPYYACSVSTCNRGATLFAFCSVNCWDAHVPVLRHRDAWAEEATAPTAAEAAASERPAEAPRPAPGGAASASSRAATPAAARPAQAEAVPREVLVVVSKLKAYIRARSGMHTSDDMIDPLSDHLRRVCDRAIEHARAAGRKTVMARDLSS